MSNNQDVNEKATASAGGRIVLRFGMIAVAWWVVIAFIVPQISALSGLAGTLNYIGWPLFLIGIGYWLRKAISNEMVLVDQTQNQMAKQIEDLAKELKIRDQEYREVDRELKRLAVKDTLTGIFNQRYFSTALMMEWRRMLRDNGPVSLFSVDIDGLRYYNDNFGLHAGDACIKKVADILSMQVKRPGDVVARLSGDRFGVLLPNTNRENALRLAENVLSAVQGLNIASTGSPMGNRLTVSIGLACWVPNRDRDHEELMALADKALVEARDAGRNQIKVADLSDSGD